jgi:tetratricopeptide (TPR) repeat protein
MATLSLVVIFKNEANYIENCIRSVLNIVDEVIAVDSHSTDGSDAIIRSLQAKDPKIKYFQRVWPDNFSDQRNFALTQAKSDWILFLDADERLAIPDHKKLLAAIQNQDIDAYELPILNYTLDVTEVGYTPNTEAPYPYGYVVTHLHRLFRNKENFRYEGILHEKIEPSLEKNKARMAALDIAIHHLGRIKEAEQSLKDQRYHFYLGLSEKKVKENPSDAQAHWELGVIYQKLNRLKEAHLEFAQALKLSPQTEEFEVYVGLVLFQLSDWSTLVTMQFKHPKAQFFQRVARAQTDPKAIEDLDEFRNIFSQAALIIFELSLKHHRNDRIPSDRDAALKYFDKSGLVEFLEGSQKRRDGDFQSARAVLDVSIRKGCQVSILEFLLAVTQANDFDSAIQFYHHLSDSERSRFTPDARKVLAFAAQKLGKNAEDYLHGRV